ncbi:MAG: glycerophosphodiester phosphodiesterase [Gammaproteobacteria bacterium]|nr:MAG: glycerophosphodiester phosphodiesterase [Gammaproteobacteria bacterium]RLA62415.1 MAG: glycerophosphodiester phosphodiesterase [Gammaproteobacteria bacterium]
MRLLLQNVMMKAVDWAVASIPQPVPDQVALRHCKIISHRGEHDNISVIENTLPAFDNARANGVWGIECDIRWTADLVPVICHDPCGQRLFGNRARVGELSFTDLRAQMPLIPSLTELVGEFGSNTHLMLEIKAELYPQLQRQKAILREQLSTLSPGLDYHFLALDPELFTKVDFVPRNVCLPVAQLNTSRLSRAALATRCGGLNGHYLLLTDKLRRRHELAGQRVGAGFIRSKNCLFRELNRGAEWFFSNDAVKLQKIRDRYLQ